MDKTKKTKIIPQGQYMIVNTEMLFFPPALDQLRFDFFEFEAMDPGEATEASIFERGEVIPCIYLSLSENPIEAIEIRGDKYEYPSGRGQYFLFREGIATSLLARVAEKEKLGKVGNVIFFREDTPINEIKYEKHLCNLDDCDWVACGDLCEKLGIEEKKFQIMVAKKYGLHCYFKDGCPHVVYNIRDPKAREKLGNKLSMEWGDAIHLVSDGHYLRAEGKFLQYTS